MMDQRVVINQTSCLQRIRSLFRQGGLFVLPIRLTAQTTNRLAFFAQASGDNLKTAAANAYEGVDAAFSQRELFEQIGTISDSIAITFGGNLELMVGTANEAKRLGLKGGTALYNYPFSLCCHLL